jgi:hypothetical protein
MTRAARSHAGRELAQVLARTVRGSFEVAA